MTKAIKLSARLKCICDMVQDGANKKIHGADIGCDHGYISIYLVQEKIADRMLAMDINEGPLKRAEENIREYALSDRIETRLSDGLSALSHKEADTVIIAGMGGKLMADILFKDKDKLKGIDSLVLQPQSDIPEFRRELIKNGFEIADERIIYDEGKYYFPMRAKRCVEDEASLFEYLSNDIYMIYGKHTLEEKSHVMQDYHLKQKKKLDKIKEELAENETDRAADRLTAIEREIDITERALNYMQA